MPFPLVWHATAASKRPGKQSSLPAPFFLHQCFPIAWLGSIIINKDGASRREFPSQTPSSRHPQALCRSLTPNVNSYLFGEETHTHSKRPEYRKHCGRSVLAAKYFAFSQMIPRPTASAPMSRALAGLLPITSRHGHRGQKLRPILPSSTHL